MNFNASMANKSLRIAMLYSPRRYVVGASTFIATITLSIVPLSAQDKDGTLSSALTSLDSKADRLISGYEAQSYSANSTIDKRLVALARSYGRLAEKAIHCAANESKIMRAYQSTFGKLSKHFTYRNFYYEPEPTIAGYDERMKTQNHTWLADVYARDGAWTRAGSSSAPHGHVSVTSSKAPFIQGREMIHSFAEPDCSHYSGELRTLGDNIDWPR